MDRFRPFLTLALTLSLMGAIAMGCNTGTEEPAAPQADSAEDAAAGDDTGGKEAGAMAADATDTPDDIHPSRFPELPAGAEAIIPDNYPSDLPLYPGAVPAQGRGLTNENGDMAAVQLLTNDSPEEAIVYYAEELESKGWNATTTGGTGGNNTSMAAEKDDCKAIVMFVPSPNGPTAAAPPHT